ncbi:hypothetical protein [Aulosira sp. FACHB-615]|uniref:hypothetical protein n=1 Tax=Aulosira sp. FACHB-615 TaxID=2692777 RepID=UPI00168669A8|nr:hypothetical protein [Aulosira sp. FACHB-615]MBD2489433.1 hypothetical protein [Aulosira sp. FACHB-615]
MAGWEIRVDIPYSYNGSPTIPYSYYPVGCFRGGYNYYLNGGDFILTHADGETRLGGGWLGGYAIQSFNVVNLAPCCPEGWMRCKNANGTYCCLPCDEIKNSIASITANLRNVK